jgi:anaerobic ribonucleoside-triphosphate reductase activating protein
MSKISAQLNIGAWHERSLVNGPGVRSVLWLQGCETGCPGCINPELQPCEPRTLLSVEEAAARVLATEGIEGVTYSGGEPLRQAKALVALSERLRAAGLSVVSYTGYTLEALRARGDADIDRLLGMIDLLIDGPYDPAQAANLRWRGSRNQRVIALTDRYRGLAVGDDPAEVELSLDDARLSASGIWPPGLLERLKELLHQ